MEQKAISLKRSVWRIVILDAHEPNPGYGSLVFGEEGFIGILGEFELEPTCFYWS